MAAHLETLIEGLHLGEGDRYLDRELSWLDFNARVLSLADSPGTPLLERAKFLAIYSQNLDEFFQVRVAGLKDQVEAGIDANERLDAVRDRVLELQRHLERVFLDEVVPGLADGGIQLSDWAALDADDREHLVRVFDEEVFPVLTPLAVDPAHPFPYISNLSLNLGVLVRDPMTGERRFARVKVPNLLPRFVVMPDGERYVPLEQVIAEHLDALFPGMEILAHHPFRVTRNTDLTLEEEDADDLLQAVELEIRRRRFGRAVRLEVPEAMDEQMLALLVRELDLVPDDVYATSAPLDLGGLWNVSDLARPDLKDEPFKSVTPHRLAADEDDKLDIFAAIREGDVLVHHPYESFSTSVTAFIQQAARDPAVLAIKQTLYRTSADSPIVAALIEAAIEGKQVVALVELKARFDEQANVGWAKVLERAGVHVVYGIVGLKTHTKTALVVRQEPDGVRRYCHIGTGNYNEKTARTYEDLGLLTCDPAVGADLSQLFNFLTGYGRQERSRKLVLAPGMIRPRLLELIEAEARTGGRITMKMNSLVDKEMIDALYAASEAGVAIDLVVRGICCLRPGIPGLSENIRVRSIIGRFLEHSRIYCFANGQGPGRPVYLVGSADLMPRNLDKRVEALVPIDEPLLQARLQEVLDVNLADDELAWELLADGAWKRVPVATGVNTHQVLERLAAERARPRQLPGREATVVKVSDAVEREVKVAVWPGFALPDLDDVAEGILVVPAGEKRQEAVYHDTPDLRLARADITLRHRSDDGWTLKLPEDGPAGDDALSRREITIAEDPRTVPEHIRSLVAARVRTSVLAPVARLHTVRNRTDLLDGHGAKVAEVVDDEVSVLDGRRVALRFREVEVEVLEGAPDGMLEEIVGRLRVAGAGAPDRTPKVMRALGPPVQAPAELAEVRLGSSPTAAEVLRAGMVKAAGRLLEHDPGLRTTEDDEAVPQARVATRRLRSDLRTYGDLLDDDWVATLREELKWLADLLGGVRDADVLMMRFERQLGALRRPDRIVGTRLLDRLGDQRAEARARLRDALDSARYLALLDRVVEGAEAPRTTPAADAPAAEVLPRLFATPWRALEKGADRIGSGSPDEALHRVRIKAKRAWYAADVAALVVGAPAAKLSEAVAGVQEVLGEHQDVCVARDWLRQAALQVDAPVAFVAGQLAAQQDVEADAHREELPAAWKRASKGKLRTWLKP